MDILSKCMHVCTYICLYVVHFVCTIIDTLGKYLLFMKGIHATCNDHGHVCILLYWPW